MKRIKNIREFDIKNKIKEENNGKKIKVDKSINIIIFIKFLET